MDIHHGLIRDLFVRHPKRCRDSLKNLKGVMSQQPPTSCQSLNGGMSRHPPISCPSLPINSVRQTISLKLELTNYINCINGYRSAAEEVLI